MNGKDLVNTDLHGHTHFSDGRCSPEEFVAFRARKRFAVIALSDHDTFAGVERAAVEARKHVGLTLVPAMEATSFIHFGTERAEQIHILAYFPPAFAVDGRLWRTQLHARAQQIARAWRTYLLGFIARQDDETRALLSETVLQALPLADFPQLQTFISTIGAQCPALYPAFQLDHVHFWDDALFSWQPEELMETIRADGGLDVVAHPIRARDKARLDEVLSAASGIEVYTSRHSPEVSRRFLSLAESLGKHWTASSDDHQHRPYVHPASGTPARTVRRILDGR